MLNSSVVEGASDGLVRVYAHCARNRSGVALVFINMRPRPVALVLPAAMAAAARDEYHLSAASLSSKTMLLNGKPLELVDGQLPPMPPKAMPAGGSAPLQLAGYTYGFAVVHSTESLGVCATSVVKTDDDSSSPRNILLVDHGAACDGSTVDTAAFRSAFSAAAAAVRGGASAVVVRVPRGKLCITAPFNISANKTTLYLEAGSTVKASDDPALWPRTAVHPWPTYGPSRTLSCFIGMFSVHGSGIAGPGAIDMNGEAWHGGKLDPKNDFLDLPHFLLVYNSSDVLLRGARLLNGACWNLHLLYSTRCTIDRLRIETPFKGTDGIDVDSSTHVTIANTYISNGDE